MIDDFGLMFFSILYFLQMTNLCLSHVVLSNIIHKKISPTYDLGEEDKMAKVTLFSDTLLYMAILATVSKD